MKYCYEHKYVLLSIKPEYVAAISKGIKKLSSAKKKVFCKNGRG